jgi:hypothetical protein
MPRLKASLTYAINTKGLSMACAVVIPIYKNSLSENERISLFWTLNNLASHEIYVICPQNLYTFFSLNLSPIKAKIKPFPDYFFKSVSGYNRLLKSKNFYSSFLQYKYILIAQLDCLVLRDELDHWCDLGYSYIGAPWFEGDANPAPGANFIGVGNGGFSLRHVDHHIRVLSSFRYLPYKFPRKNAHNYILKAAKYAKHEVIFAFSKPPLMCSANEDAFWGMAVPPEYDYFRIPSPHEALSFSFEVNPRRMYEITCHKLPFGCHAWDKYDKSFWMEILPNNFFTAPKAMQFLI